MVQPRFSIVELLSVFGIPLCCFHNLRAARLLAQIAAITSDKPRDNYKYYVNIYKTGYFYRVL